jgi:catechol 2,3-dioxygenase-like lactoylglutathione lyase family enzyme
MQRLALRNRGKCMKLGKTVISLAVAIVFGGQAQAEIKRVAISSVFVTDFAKAKSWYTNMLGFQVARDIQFGPNPEDRWISLSAKSDSSVQIVLKIGAPITHQLKHPDLPEAILTVFTDDLTKTASELKARGVVFAMEPQHDPWAFEAMVLDHDGQGIVIAESRSEGSREQK